MLAEISNNSLCAVSIGTLCRSFGTDEQGKWNFHATHHKFPDYAANRYSTHPEDMPEAFRDIVEWDDERIRSWAKSIGKSTGAVIDRIFSYVDIKEQGYNPGLAVLRLSRTYSDARLETACELALARGIRSPRYRHLKAILSANQDIVYKEQQEAKAEPEDTSMGYLRGRQ